MVTFTKYALDKFDILARHNYSIAKEEILRVMSMPDSINTSKAPLLIAEAVSHGKTIRVVYKEELSVQNVLTFYPVCPSKE